MKPSYRVFSAVYGESYSGPSFQQAKSLFDVLAKMLAGYVEISCDGKVIDFVNT